MAFLDFTYKILQVIRNSVGILVLIVIFYILQYIFNMHFLCSCKPGLHINGVLYMVLPPVILTLIIAIVEPFHQRKIVYCCNSVKSFGCCLCSYGVKFVFKCVGLAAVWIAAVLFDGDWYVCLMTNFNKNQTGLPCRNNLTYEEQRIVGHYMTDSLDYGLILICVFLFVWSTCEIRRLSCRQSWSRAFLTPYYRVVFKDLLAEEVSTYLNDKLKRIATKKAKMICKPCLVAIKTHELSGINEDDEEASNAWEKISVPGFYLMEDETQEAAECA